MKITAALGETIAITEAGEQGVKLQVILVSELDEQQLRTVLSRSRSGIVELHLEE